MIETTDLPFYSGFIRSIEQSSNFVSADYPTASQDIVIWGWVHDLWSLITAMMVAHHWSNAFQHASAMGLYPGINCFPGLISLSINISESPKKEFLCLCMDACLQPPWQYDLVGQQFVQSCFWNCRTAFDRCKHWLPTAIFIHTYFSMLNVWCPLKNSSLSTSRQLQTMLSTWGFNYPHVLHVCCTIADFTVLCSSEAGSLWVLSSRVIGGDENKGWMMSYMKFGDRYCAIVPFAK